MFYLVVRLNVCIALHCISAVLNTGTPSNTHTVNKKLCLFVCFLLLDDS